MRVLFHLLFWCAAAASACVTPCALAGSALGWFEALATGVVPLSAGMQLQLGLVDLVDGSCITLPMPPGDSLLSLEVSEDEKCFYTWRRDPDAKNCLLQYKISFAGNMERTGSLTVDFPQEIAEPRIVLRPSPDRKWLLAELVDANTLAISRRVIDTRTQGDRLVPADLIKWDDSHHLPWSWCVDWVRNDAVLIPSPDGLQLLSLPSMTTDKVYKKDDSSELASTKVSPDRKWAIVSEDPDGHARSRYPDCLASLRTKNAVLNVATKKVFPLSMQTVVPGSHVPGYDWSPNSEYIVQYGPAADQEGVTIAVLTREGKQLAEFTQPGQSTMDFFFSNDKIAQIIRASNKGHTLRDWIAQIIRPTNKGYTLRLTDWKTGEREERPLSTLPEGCVLERTLGSPLPVPVDGGRKLVCLVSQKKQE